MSEPLIPDGTPGTTWDKFRDASIDAVKETLKASPCVISVLLPVNRNATTVYLQFYDKLAATVTIGTTVPDWTMPIPNADSTTPLTKAGLAGGVLPPPGLSFKIGCVYAATTTYDGLDATALTTPVSMSGLMK